MAALDIGKVLDSLHSSKIKDRNGALDLLDVITSSKLRLNAKQFRLITVGIFTLIRTEHAVLANMRTPAVESRLNRASLALRILVSKSFDEPAISFKYRVYADIVNSISSLYNHNPNLADPCLPDFLVILTKSLAHSVYREHITSSDWSKIFAFLVKMIHIVLEEAQLDRSSSGEKLCAALYESLLHLVESNAPPSITHTQLLLCSSRSVLIDVLAQTISVFPKELLLTVLIFRLINKLIIVSGAEDFNFVHQVLKLGIGLFVAVHLLSWKSLQVQLLIFLNLSAMRRFLVLQGLPRLTDNDSIPLHVDDSICQSDPDISIRSDPPPPPLTNSCLDSLESLSNSVRILLQALLRKFNTSAFQIQHTSIGLFHGNHNSLVWLKLGSIYLKSTEVQGWLLARGVAQLLSQYFVLKRMISPDHDQTPIALNSLQLTTPSMYSHPYKRRKTDPIAENLLACLSVEEFCTNLISHTADKGIVQVGLITFTFFLEMQSIPPLKVDNSRPGFSDDSQGFYEELEYRQTQESYDTSLFSLELPAMIEATPTQVDYSLILKSIIGTFDSSDSSFWTLLALNSYASKAMPSLGPQLISFYQLLMKLALQSLNRPSFCAVACNILSLIEKQNLIERAQYDKTMLTQLESIVDLADINGPAILCNESFYAWFMISSRLKHFGSLKYPSIGNKIVKWFDAKWKDSDLSAPYFFATISDLPYFISWLHGLKVCFQRSPETPGLNREAINEYSYWLAQYEGLEAFISLEPAQHLKCLNMNETPESIQAITPRENLMDSLNRTTDSLVRELAPPANVLQWSMLLLRSSTLLQVDPTWSCASDELRNIASDSLRFLHSAYAAGSHHSELMVVANSINIDDLDSLCKEFLLAQFPFELISGSESAALVARFDLDQSDETAGILEREFSTDRLVSPESVGYIGRDTSIITLRYTVLPVVEYTKFLLGPILKASGSNPMSRLLQYVEKLKGLNLILSFHAIIEAIDCGSLALADVSHDWLQRLVRLMGEQLLSNPQYERKEILVNVVSGLLRVLLPALADSSTSNFKQDYIDVSSWLISCAQSHLILTLASLISLCQYLSSAISCRTDVLPRSVAWDLLLSLVKSCLNAAQVDLVPWIVRVICSCSSEERESFYSSLLAQYVTPEKSVECIATYALILLRLAQGCPQVMLPSIFKLLEFSRFPYFVKYLQRVLMDLTHSTGVNSPRLFFKSICLELMRSWWMCDKFSRFPFQLFGYTSLELFYADNYRELIAIAVSTRSEDDLRARKFVDAMVKIKQSDEVAIVMESMPIIIPLLYTPDGIRNQVFQFLSASLGESYEREVGAKLLLIVLEIVLLTDVSSDRLILEHFKESGSSASQLFGEKSTPIIAPLMSTIEPRSSMELINKLIEKYGATGEKWSEPRVYFLLRRVTNLLVNSSNTQDRLMYLKKVKFIASFGLPKRVPLSITRLLICSLTPLMGCEVLSLDISRVLSALNLQTLMSFGESEAIPLAIIMTDALLKFPGSPAACVIANELKFFVDLPLNEPLVEVIVAAASVMHQNKCRLSTRSIEALFGSSKQLQLCMGQFGQKHLFDLLDRLFPYIKVESDRGPRDIIAQNLLKAIRNSQWQSSAEFSKWCARYLANYYLDGSAMNTYADAFLIQEFAVITKKAFTGYTSTLNDSLEIIISCLHGPNLDAAACAETILGVLIHKFKTLRKHVQRHLDFSQTFSVYSPYILELDFHSCILLNDETDMDILGDDMAHIVENFCSLIASQPYEVWTTRILLAFIQRAAVYTTIAPLLASFFVKFKHLSAKALPGFICFTIGLEKRRGLDVACLLLNAFVALKTHNKEALKLFLRIILLLRVGSKVESTVFCDFMSKLDLRAICTMIADANLPKTTLLLFEDHSAPHDITEVAPSERSIITRAYEAIDEFDLLAGLPAKSDVDFSIGDTSGGGNSLVDLMLHSASFDADIATGRKCSKTEIIRSVVRSGMMGISKLISTSDESHTNDDTTYEWAWKLGCWEFPQPKYDCKEHRVMYGLLKLIHDFPQSAPQLCEELMISVFCSVKHIVEKGSSGIAVRENSLQWFRTMAAIAAVENAMTTADSSTFMNLTKWFESSHFSHSENILLARQGAWSIQDARSKADTEIASSYRLQSIQELSRYNNICRVSNDLQRSVSLSVMLSKLAETDFATSTQKDTVLNLTKYHAALTLWMQGQQITPVQILRDLIAESSTSLSNMPLSIHLVVIHATLVQWLSSSRQKLPAHILRDHVFPAADISLHTMDGDERSRVYGMLARFCEDQYRSEPLVNEILRLEQAVSAKRAEVNELKSHYSHTAVVADEKKSVQRYYSRLKAQLASDMVDLDVAKESQVTFCDLLVKYYLNSVTVLDSDTEDLDKFCALWLEHAHKDELSVQIFDEVLGLPAYKLVGWCTQLVSRLSNDASQFQRLLKEIVIKLCLTHPFHTLYQLISLRINEPHATSQLLGAKAAAANTLWAELQNKSPTYVAKVLGPVEIFCKEASTLAEHKITRGKTLHLDRVPLGKYWLESLPAIPPPTKLLAVNPLGCYDSAPVFASCEPKVAIASLGISLPKITSFLLSDGLSHKVLFKHLADDLRQDLIMEQVFEKVNHILDRDQESKRRRLRIRTYKAVPLGPQQGLLEFVPNSAPLIDVIGPYHQARDIYKLDEARRVMKEAQLGLKQQRFDAYCQVERNVAPVLRHFFLDSFVNPEEWFESRLIYSYGLATTSIVGHVLGLGDRHCNNILLDRRTGEPIHIDLGVAFEQGKQLPIPETVPFRLTRDLVDGLGITGVEGVFRRGCERTLREMRRNKLHILAILDVLRWDSLYSWTISPLRKKRLQEQDGEPVKLQPEADGTEAGLAVRTVSRKLESGGLRTEATVRELIQQATSEQNLLMIYFGWCPFY